MRFLLIYILLFWTSLSAQNLVSNPSFEDYDSCPEKPNQLINAVGWFSSIMGSSDYFNICTSNKNLSIPYNAVGVQLALSGNAYAGGYFFSQTYFHREYITTKLKNALIESSRYKVSFYVSLADYCKVGISNINVIITQSLPTTIVDSIGIISLDTVIIDTSDWVKVEGIYLAEGGEQYLTIGNFNDDTNTSYYIFNNNATIPSAYYYIDDVSLVKLPNPYDLAVRQIIDPNRCYTGQDSLLVQIKNQGDTLVDFTQDTLHLKVEISHQGSLHNSFSITLSNYADSLAVDSSLNLLVNPVDFSLYNRTYEITASLEFKKDRNKNNNVLDTLLQTELSVGEISVSSNVLCAGSELSLSSQNYKGQAYWEYSNNSIDWQLLSQGAKAKHQANATTYYRMRICSDLYSDTFQLNVIQSEAIAEQNFNPCVKGDYTIEIETPAAVQNLNWYSSLSDSAPFHQGMTYETAIKSDQLYYVATVIDSCESAERTPINLKLGGCPLYIPNVFSPNGDGLNDVFRYANAEGHDNIQTVIYNRWGNKIAEWSGNAGWDGGNHPTGSYKYVIKTENKKYMGELLLVR